MNKDIRELNTSELDAVSGGNLAGSELSEIVAIQHYDQWSTQKANSNSFHLPVPVNPVMAPGIK
jgi:hypothetical protein